MSVNKLVQHQTESAEQSLKIEVHQCGRQITQRFTQRGRSVRCCVRHCAASRPLGPPSAIRQAANPQRPLLACKISTLCLFVIFSFNIAYPLCQYCCLLSAFQDCMSWPLRPQMRSWSNVHTCLHLPECNGKSIVARVLHFSSIPRYTMVARHPHVYA